MPNFGPIATFFAADLPPALSAFLGTHKTLRTNEKGLIVGLRAAATLSLRKKEARSIADAPAKKQEGEGRAFSFIGGVAFHTGVA
jgi:hypothetical protein